MKGSDTANIKFDPEKQKLIDCMDCGAKLIVNKFHKNKQNCISVGYQPADCKKKGLAPRESNSVKRIDQGENVSLVSSDDSGFSMKMQSLMKELGFEIDANLRYKKKYAVDGGAICTIYPYVEKGIAGEEPRVEYFSMIVQRAVGVNENFRDIMSPDAASDCELIASELSNEIEIKPKIGMQKCDKCGALTDEFGVDNNRDLVLCVKPNSCFMKYFNNAGAEASTE